MEECINKKCMYYDKDENNPNNCLTEIDITICPNHLMEKIKPVQISSTAGEIQTKEIDMDCPMCRETMVPSRIEHEEGEWAYGWLCGCNEEIRKQNDDSPVLCSDGLLLRLLDEMRIETVECLWDHADSEDLDKQTCESMTSRLEDFFNQKIYDIKRKQ